MIYRVYIILEYSLNGFVFSATHCYDRTDVASRVLHVGVWSFFWPETINKADRRLKILTTRLNLVRIDRSCRYSSGMIVGRAAS